MSRDVLELDDFQDEADQLADVLAELDQDSDPVVIRIYRAPRGGNKRMQFCFEVLAEEFDYSATIEEIRSTYGAGEFRLMVRQGGKMRRNLPLSIAAPVEQPERPEPAAPAALSGGDMRDVLREMQTMILQQQNDLLTTLLKHGGNRGGGMEIKDVIEAARMLTPPQQQQQDPFQLFTQFMGLQKDMGLSPHPPGESDMWVSAIKDLGQPLLQLVGSMQAAPRAAEPAGRPQQLGQAQPQPQAQPEPQPQPNPAPEQHSPLAILRQHMPMLLRAAERDSDPGAYAVVLLDLLPDPVLQLVVQLAQQPDAIGHLARMAPEVEPYRDWFAELLADLPGLTTQEPDTDPDGHPQTGYSDAASPGHQPAPAGDPVPTDADTGRGAGHSGDAAADAPDGEGGPEKS